MRTTIHVSGAKSLDEATHAALEASRAHVGIGVTQQNLDGTYSIDLVLCPNRDDVVYDVHGRVQRFATGERMTREDM